MLLCRVILTISIFCLMRVGTESVSAGAEGLLYCCGDI